jgi:hypothetical protein
MTRAHPRQRSLPGSRKLTLYRKQATANILFDEARGVWLVKFTPMSEDKEFKNAIRDVAAEGGCLKEALMNLADKTNV